MPAKNLAYNVYRINQLSEHGYRLIAELPDEGLRWPILKLKKRMGLFLYVRNNLYYQCQDNFLRATSPLTFDSQGELIEQQGFSQIDTMSYIFVLIETSEGKQILLIRQDLESGHSLLAGPYYGSPLAKAVVGGEIHFEDKKLFMINNKSGCLRNNEKDVRIMLNSLLGETFTAKVFCADNTEEEVKASYNELSPRVLQRNLVKPLSSPRPNMQSLLSPLTENRRLSSFTFLSPEAILPEASLLSLSTRKGTDSEHASPTLCIRVSSSEALSQEEKPMIVNQCPVQPLSIFAKSNPLIDFIEKPSHQCEGVVLSSGIQLVSAALIRYPNSILSIMANSMIPASFLLADLNVKIQKHHINPQNGCVSNLEMLYKHCLPRLVRLCIYTSHDLERCIAAMPSYRVAVLDLVLSNEFKMKQIFSSSLTGTSLETKDALVNKYPTFKDRIENCFSHYMAVTVDCRMKVP